MLAVAVTPPRNAPLPPFRTKSQAGQNKDDQSGKGLGPIASKDLGLAPETRIVVNEMEFSSALAEDRNLNLILQHDLHFSEAVGNYHGGQGGKRMVEIKSADPQKPTTLMFSYAPDSETQMPFWAGLTIDGGSVTFKNIKVGIEASFTPHELAAAIAVKAGQVVFDHCTFVQETPREELIGLKNLTPIASVAAWNSGMDRPPVVFRNCYFPAGQAAVSVNGSARVQLDNCAMGPHECLFHLWGQNKDKDMAEIDLSHISATVVDGPVFRLDEGTQCALSVRYSIFSCPSNATSLDRPDLIRLTAGVREVKYDGKRNAYHQLMSFWARPIAGKDEVEATDWPGFKALSPWPAAATSDRQC